jgi:uncharacterized protein (DUF2147 family)
MLRGRLLNSFVAACMLAAPLGAQSTSPEGRWKTIDDKTGAAKGIIVITSVNGELEGRVERVFSPPSPSPNPLCEECTGELKKKPIIGMRVLWGFKLDGNKFTGGRVLDPESGKIYKGTIAVADGGRKLDLRGYVGIPMFGRTQTWQRE